MNCVCGHPATIHSDRGCLKARACGCSYLEFSQSCPASPVTQREKGHLEHRPVPEPWRPASSGKVACWAFFRRVLRAVM